MAEEDGVDPTGEAGAVGLAATDGPVILDGAAALDGWVNQEDYRYITKTLRTIYSFY